ncbi:DUF6090 family protein [Robiginitalea sp. SC105]|uniref:DUF6090 family protein n=1 Tax=Robiginitalea sp. SC105 TaxID=2762332 RepID=UPI00163AECFB|nr:DUF6090 family protein [Robiginitalea sp. SC105]MBC2840057.1 hypothetical protein [Robiginitalea sp. SC105]
MIKLFNKIRMGLLGQSKTRQYLLYALGEIVLVMIGILLALQVNNWNIEQQNNREEQELLAQLEVDYLENLAEVNEKIYMRNGMLASIQALFGYIDHGIDTVSLDSVGMHLSRVGLTPTFDGANGVTNQILNSGKLHLIRNQELRTNLTNWQGTTQKVIEEEQLMVQAISSNFRLFLIQGYNLRELRENGLSDRYSQSFMLSKNRYSEDFDPITRNYEPEEFRRLLRDYVFSNYLIQIDGMCRVTNQQAMGLREKIERILEIIRSEMEPMR